MQDKIIEKSNADLLIKLINNSENLTEAIAIAELGTTYKRTGFHFDKRLEKVGNTIKYFKKNTALSFSDGTDDIPNKLIIGDNYLISSAIASEERLYIPTNHNVYLLPRDLYKQGGRLMQGAMEAFLQNIISRQALLFTT